MRENKRVQAITAENLTEHISRIKAAIQRYHITDPRFMFNTDQSGPSFENMKGRSLRKGIGSIGARLVQRAFTTKGCLDRVTVMSIVSGCGVAYKRGIVFPGKLAHYRKVQGEIQILHSVLSPCYLFQGNPPCVDMDIVYDWVKGFVEETENLRKNGQRLLLLLDGRGGHIQHKTLKLFKDNHVVVIALPVHTSHTTQPLDTSVFSSYKSQLQHELYKAARQKQKLNAFDVLQCISNASSSSYTATNIRSGSHKTGVWDMELLAPNVAPLQKYLVETNRNKVSSVTVEALLERFANMHRTLLRDAVIQEDGHVRIDTTGGSRLTSDSVVKAVYLRIVTKLGKQKVIEDRELAAANKEP